MSENPETFPIISHQNNSENEQKDSGLIDQGILHQEVITTDTNKGEPSRKKDTL